MDSSHSALLRCGAITALPVVHGRLACAVLAARLIESGEFTDVAVELPASMAGEMLAAIDALPRIHTILYREDEEYEGHRAPRWHVPADPCDAVVEALRRAREQGLTLHCVDLDVRGYRAKPLTLPDPWSALTLGAEAWYEALLPLLRQHPRDIQDLRRERHMAAMLQRIVAAAGTERRVLFVTGLAHWESIREMLASGDTLPLEQGHAPSHIERRVLACASLREALTEFPWVAARWERARRRGAAARYDAMAEVPRLLLAARDLFERQHGDTLERPDTAKLRALVSYARKLSVRAGRLFPDAFTLASAAKCCVGNDYTLALLETLAQYPHNPASGLVLERGAARMEDDLVPLERRSDGEARELRMLRLRRPPPRPMQRRWRKMWDPNRACSWLPEDSAIEAFRRHVSGGALSLAGIERRRVEPFSTSFLDGLDLRATARDPLQRLHVREEPRVPGRVGSVVILFEDDPEGTRFPWRMTWYGEKEWESTLAFYSTDPMAEPVGPGVARAHYGGAMFLYPSQHIPDIWDDLRFEQSRTSGERLLRAAIYWSMDRFIVHVAEAPPAEHLMHEAALHGRHIVHVPLSAYSATQLARLRRFHVLNGAEVRSWAGRWIR